MARIAVADRQARRGAEGDGVLIPGGRRDEAGAPGHAGRRQRQLCVDEVCFRGHDRRPLYQTTVW